MSADQFSLWLNNRHLINQLDDETIESKQTEIISFFGGFRNMLINIFMENQFIIDLDQHQQLFKLLNDFKLQQEECKQILATTNIGKTTPLIIHIHDIEISNIFTFLCEKDNISLQQTCKLLTIIGRRKESFIQQPVDNKLYKHLSLPHKFNNIKKTLKKSFDDDHDINISYFEALEFIVKTKWNRDIVKSLKIIPLIFDICDETKDFCVCIYILQHFILENLQNNKMCEYSLIKYNIFGLMVDALSYFQTEEETKINQLFKICIKIFDHLVKFNKSYINLWHDINLEELCTDYFFTHYDCIDIVEHCKGSQFVQIYKALVSNMSLSDKKDILYVLRKRLGYKQLCSLTYNKIIDIFIQSTNYNQYEAVEEIINILMRGNDCDDQYDEIRNTAKEIMDYFECEIKEGFETFLIHKLEQNPSDFVYLLHKVLRSRTFGADFKRIIMKFKCDINKILIDLCINLEHRKALAMHCCLSLIDGDEQKWIDFGIIDVFKQYLIWYVQTDNKWVRYRYKFILRKIIKLLHEWKMKRCNKENEILLDASISQYILNNMQNEEELIKIVKESNIWIKS